MSDESNVIKSRARFFIIRQTILDLCDWPLVTELNVIQSVISRVIEPVKVKNVENFYTLSKISSQHIIGSIETRQIYNILS